MDAPTQRFPRNPHNLVLHPKARDLTDQRFGRLVALYPERHAGLGWVCQCDCGNQSWVRTDGLITKHTVSCGCHKAEQLSMPRPVHGQARSKYTGPPTKTYQSWVSMKGRCCNPNNDDWHHYGGRGIKVCDRWLNSFENFLADMGEAPPKKSIDRIDTNGDYAPGNCRWATQMEQTNNMRKNHIVEANGKAQSIAMWTRELGFSRSVIPDRLRTGWSHHDAVNTPVGVRRTT